MINSEILDNIEDVISENLPKLLSDGESTKSIYRILWEIYEYQFDADEERDGQFFDDMVQDALQYGIK